MQIFEFALTLKIKYLHVLFELHCMHSFCCVKNTKLKFVKVVFIFNIY